MGPKGTLIPAFPPARRRKGRFMDLVRDCDGLFPLPVKEKAVMKSEKHNMRQVLRSNTGVAANGSVAEFL